MKKDADVQLDIKNNKVKEGYLVKRSRILKQWKTRWMVLTKTHLYSFIQKGVYKSPTQKIPLKEVSTIKSYYKNQYQRPQVIRVQSDDAHFYLSAKNHQQKWAWMTAIQKMTDLVICPQSTNDTQNLIRQTIRMSSAIRQTISTKIEKKQEEIPKDLFKKLKMILQSNICQCQILPTLKEPEAKQVLIKKQQQSSPQKNKRTSIVNQMKQKIQKSIKQQQQINYKQKIVEVQKIVIKQVRVPEVQKIVIKQVRVPQIIQKEVQKIVQKIVYVPEIKQVVKTVYVNKQGSQNQIQQFLEDLILSKNQNPKPFIDFIVYIPVLGIQKYIDNILKFTINQNTQRFFAQLLLLILNQQIQEDRINAYVKFITIIYQNNYEYFYSSDIKILIDILLRQIDMNRSQFNQYLIVNLLNVMADKKWFQQIKHRKQELIQVLKDISAWNGGSQNKFLAQQLLSKL